MTLVVPFCTRNRSLFAKTGSGQTQEKVGRKGRLSAAILDGSADGYNRAVELMPDGTLRPIYDFIRHQTKVVAPF
jgi:hypothetical protein